MSTFAPQFNSFMLPYLALTAQLPFGAPNYWDNFSAITLTIGSPTLAIFSLTATVLNSRWLKRRFSRISYPNAKQAVIVLNNLQQSLLRVEYPLLASLIVLPQNDQWWRRGADAVSFTQTWSLVNIASVLWVIVAYIFTIVVLDEPGMSAIGPAVACAWLWLLAAVVGWMQLSPNCDEVKLKAALASLNQTVYIAGAGPADDPIKASEVTDHFAIMVWPVHCDNNLAPGK
jgi:uncharacterized protein with PQ loop repeat